MLVLSGTPGDRMVSYGPLRYEDVRRGTLQKWRSENAHHRTDQQEQDERLRYAAMRVLRSSSYSALRRLRCEAKERVIALYGILPSYYLKQMAQAAIQRLEGIRGIANLVEVQTAHCV